MAQFLLLLLQLLLLYTRVSPTPTKVYNIATFGAKSGERTDSTRPLLKAWAAACGSAGAATIIVPEGRFLVGRADFTGPCKSKSINIQVNGVLSAPSDYTRLAKNGDWLSFEEVDGVTIHGGVIDGRGSNLWACKIKGRRNCPQGATVSIQCVT